MKKKSYLEDLPQFQRAVDMYKMFHWREPDEYFEMDLQWPKNQGVFGRALVTSYWSDKFDGIGRDYKHKHKSPYPAIIREKQRGDKKWNAPFYPKYEVPAFPELGKLLDIQVVYPGQTSPQYLDYKKRDLDSMPILAGDPERNLLIVVDALTGEVFLLWSPIMIVTERGIIN